MRIYSFDDVIGNANVIAMMRQSLINNTFPQISIFSGVYGTGKSTCAEIVALALTCDNSTNGNPCLGCANCRNTLNAYKTTAMSSNVVKINVGQKNKNVDVDKMINDIFVLKSSDKNMVYIIEEAHSLSDNQQTALLEELDKISKGIYVIFCTTKITRLLPELRSRAISFSFSRITDSEAEQLLDLLGSKRHAELGSPVKKIIINYSRGVPRQITNLYDFVSSGQYKSETLASFLGVISNQTFINLFDIMITGDMFMYIDCLEQIIKSYTLDIIIEQLKDFMLKVIFLLEGNLREDFYVAEIEDIRKIFLNVDAFKVASIIHGIPYNASEADFKFAMLKIKQLLSGKTLGNIISDKSVNGVLQAQNAVKVAKEVTNFKHEEQNKEGLTPINLNRLTAFGGDTV